MLFDNSMDFTLPSLGIIINCVLLVDIDERLFFLFLRVVERDVKLLAVSILAVFQKQGETVVLLDVLLDLPSDYGFHFVVTGTQGVTVLGGEQVGVEILAALGLGHLDLLALLLTLGRLPLLVLDEDLAGP